jgi:hypothetical protein
VTATFYDHLVRAIADPGSILARQEGTSIPEWGARAVLALINGVYGPSGSVNYSGTPAFDAMITAQQHRAATLAAGDLLHDAWGIIANAENFKATTVCAHRHCAEREHEIVIGMTEPIGDQQWRDAATAWRDRWHKYMDAVPPAPLACPSCEAGGCDPYLHLSDIPYHSDPGEGSCGRCDLMAARSDAKAAPRNATPAEVLRSLTGGEPPLSGVVYPQILPDGALAYPDGTRSHLRSPSPCGVECTELPGHGTGPNGLLRIGACTLPADHEGPHDASPRGRSTQADLAEMRAALAFAAHLIEAEMGRGGLAADAAQEVRAAWSDAAACLRAAGQAPMIPMFWWRRRHLTDPGQEQQ